MIWVAWRQFRTQAVVTLGVLAAFAVLVLATGLHLRHVYDSLGGAHCAARSDCTAPSGHETVLADVLGPALLAIPALLGMFWGAPLVAREFESGTYRLAWTQSVTRRRWLSVRVALVGVAALIVAGLASWLVSWWFAPLDTVHMNRFAPSVFTAPGGSRDRLRGLRVRARHCHQHADTPDAAGDDRDPHRLCLHAHRGHYLGSPAPPARQGSPGFGYLWEWCWVRVERVGGQRRTERDSDPERLDPLVRAANLTGLPLA